MAPTPLSGRLRGLDVIICCGSGGVGKTTVSAALAIALAVREDQRVALLTIDPARRLAVALGLPEVGAEPVAIPRARLRDAGLPDRGEVFAAMLDMKSTWDRMVERYAPSFEVRDRILANRFYRSASEAFVGSHEYMAIEALYELHAGEAYDCVVIDTPPSRNALDFLEAPDRLVDFVGARMLSWLAPPSRFGLRAFNLAAAPFTRMADRLVGGDVLQELTAFVADIQMLYGGLQERAREVGRLMRSPATGFVVVSTLEPAPLAEAEYFCRRLREFRLSLRGVVINRVLPGIFLDPGAVAAARSLIEQASIDRWLASRLRVVVAHGTGRRIGETFQPFHLMAAREARQAKLVTRLGGAPVARVPALEDDIAGLGALAAISEAL